MQPCTPHAVITTDSAICIGGHFYAASTLRLSCYGIFQSFNASSVVTNTEHVQTSRYLLQRIMVMIEGLYQDLFTGDHRNMQTELPHMPDVTTGKGLADLWCFANLMEFGNALHHLCHIDDDT